MSLSKQNASKSVKKKSWCLGPTHLDILW